MREDHIGLDLEYSEFSKLLFGKKVISKKKTFNKIEEIRVFVIVASVARTEKIQGLQLEVYIPPSKRKGN